LVALPSAITGQSTISGRITRINDAERWIQLSTGHVLSLAEKHYPAAVTVGSEVNVNVLNFSDGTGLVESLASGPPTLAGEEGLPGVVVIPIKCLFLRIAPPHGGNRAIFHEPLGYFYKGVYWLEQGMRLAVTGKCPTNDNLSYSMKLVLEYTTSDGIKKTNTLALSLTTGSAPVKLPTDVNPNVAAMLSATILRSKNCGSVMGRSLGLCSTEIVCVQSYWLRVRGRNAYAQVSYKTTEFALPDAPISPIYSGTHTENLVLNQVAGFTELEFTAMGYGQTNFLQSTFPEVRAVVGQQLFAVHIYDYDFVDLADPDPFAKWGTDKRSALIWPKVVGKRNGYAFSYGCLLPAIKRDMVRSCERPAQPPNYPALKNTYYRLPFHQSDYNWKQGQGNFGTFTHTNLARYSFDMGAPAGTLIRAARGGVVEAITESFSLNGWDPVNKQCTNFNANSVLIRHFDDTFGLYVHMPFNGVVVNKGDRVYRGDVLGAVGKTGCATGDHLHFAALAHSYGPTLPITFEAWTVCTDQSNNKYPCAPSRACYIPVSGDKLFSTNKEWDQ
jgi:murein DD-endopeptidase MepM/ murein hydrolase activator NlpD